MTDSSIFDIQGGQLNMAVCFLFYQYLDSRFVFVGGRLVQSLNTLQSTYSSLFASLKKGCQIINTIHIYELLRRTLGLESTHRVWRV